MDNRKIALLMQNIHQEGIFMPKSYRHISNYEKEILKMKGQGLTSREIVAKFEFTKNQVHKFI